MIVTIFCVGRPAPCPAFTSIRAIRGFVCGLFSKLNPNSYCIVCESKIGFQWKMKKRKIKKANKRLRDKPQATCKYEVGRLYRRDQQLTTWLMGTEQTDLSSVPMASSHYAEANTLIFYRLKPSDILNLPKEKTFKKDLLYQPMELLFLVRTTKFRCPSMSYGKLVKPEHVHNPDVSQSTSKEIWSLHKRYTSLYVTVIAIFMS